MPSPWSRSICIPTRWRRRGINVAVPPGLEQLILALLAKAPDQRPASAALVRETLEHLRNEVGRMTTAAESDSAQPSVLALQPELPSTANPLIAWTPVCSSVASRR